MNLKDLPRVGSPRWHAWLEARAAGAHLEDWLKTPECTAASNAPTMPLRTLVPVGELVTPTGEAARPPQESVLKRPARPLDIGPLYGEPAPEFGLRAPPEPDRDVWPEERE